MVTLREVGKMAGVSHNAPYRHFADKEALLAALVCRELQRGVVEMRQVQAGDLQMRAMLQNYVRRALRYPERFRLLYAGFAREDEALEQAGREVRAAFADAVVAAQQAGELPEGDAERLGWLLLAAAHGATIRALARPIFKNAKGATEAEELVDELFHHLGKGRHAR